MPVEVNSFNRVESSSVERDLMRGIKEKENRLLLSLNVSQFIGLPITVALLG